MRYIKRRVLWIFVLIPTLSGCQPLKPLRRFETFASVMETRMVRRALHLLMVLAAMLAGCALATKAPPVANAGPDIIAHVGETVSYDGSLSVDLDGGKIVYYHWSRRAAPEALQDEVGRVLREGEDAAVWTTESALANEDVGEWVIELRVTDDEGQSATDEMMLTVIP